MLTLLRERVGAGVVHLVATDRSDGDVHPQRVAADVLRDRQVAVTGRTWVMLDQVHGTGTHLARRGDERTPTAARGDVLVVDDDLDAAIWAADCAPVWLLGESGRRVGFHAGWRGLAAGVVDVAVDALGERASRAVLGPCIHPCCYEFGDDDRRRVAAAVGADPAEITGATTAATSTGGRGLDVPAAVRIALAHRDVELDVIGPCTGCDPRWYSHRARGEPGRHAVVSRSGR